MNTKVTKGQVAVAGAIGSAALAAALLYVTKRKKPNEPTQLPPIPGDEKPETD